MADDAAPSDRRAWSAFDAGDGSPMADGRYALRFGANGYEARGSLTIDGGRVQGGDGTCRIEGNVAESAGQVSAVINVEIPHELVGNARLPDHFSLRLTGATNDRGFHLIGIGPLGVIVDLVCTRAGPTRPGEREG